MFFIAYTTRYRGGSAEFARAAETLRAELRQKHPDERVELAALTSKHEFTAAMRRLEREGALIDELHFIGHSGMYGIMFGSTAWPEQLSPHEWRNLHIPFARGAAAYFHACRTARWFAPFFARTFGVKAFGHHGYTTLSCQRDRFVFEGYRFRNQGPLYVVSVPGKKTHGVFGSVRKYALFPRVTPMLGFEPEPVADGGYDSVAELYDRAFADIRVRRSEWRWLREHLAAAFPGNAPRVLDVGCGNGALLVGLQPLIARGVGVDVSRPMLEFARRRAARGGKLSFEAIDGPVLPFPDGSFDVVTSFLSFRYLDWDPMLREIRRVLAPGGRILIVDMVEQALSLRDLPALPPSLVRHTLRSLRDRRFTRAIAALGAHPGWRNMLESNPIRATHEYRFYLESRFPGRKLETLNVGRRARLVAFDTGPLAAGATEPQSYP